LALRIPSGGPLRFQSACAIVKQGQLRICRWCNFDQCVKSLVATDSHHRSTVTSHHARDQGIAHDECAFNVTHARGLGKAVQLFQLLRLRRKDSGFMPFGDLRKIPKNSCVAAFFSYSNWTG
jgi:hypothetical protein